MTQGYVLGLVRDRHHNLLLVRKEHPEWQAGKLNGVGGHIEAGETPVEAMDREWLEEVGVGEDGAPDWRLFAQITFSNAILFCFAGEMEVLPRRTGDVNDAGETFVSHHRLDLLPANVVPNILWLAPLAFDPAQPFVEARA